MARPERYDPEQWQYMNKPEVQSRIREMLRTYLGSFLDSAPEGAELERVGLVLAMLRKYFERELTLAKEGNEIDSLRYSKAEEVLIALSAAKPYLRSDGQVEAWVDEIRHDPPPTQEKIEEWRKLEERLRREGKEHWWD